MKTRVIRLLTILSATTLILAIIMSNISGRAALAEYSFKQLDPFFEKKLFGVKFDYNRNLAEVAPDQALALKSDLLNQTFFSNTTDPDLTEDNYMNLIGHEDKDIRSIVFVLEHIKRTYDSGVGQLEWETILPYIKVLHQFDLFSGEHVILSQDVLGIALKLNGSEFNYDNYQLGYANVPIDFLDFLTGEFPNEFLFPTNVLTFINIKESANSLQIEISYHNITYLFQSNNVDLDQISQTTFADHIVLAQFNSLLFTFNFRKYQNHGVSGVETITDVSIGKVNNLIIDENLLQDQIWNWSSEHKIEKNYKDILPINETFSWYTGSDVKKRLELFSDISLSLIFSQNIGILNGTLSIDNLQLQIDNQNKTIEELLKYDILVTDNFKILYDGSTLFSSPIGGRDFAISPNETSQSFSLVPSEIKAIALDMHPGFANERLFLQETSLIRELLGETIQRFIQDPILSSLTIDQIISSTNSDLTSAYYKQDYQIKKWQGLPLRFSLIQYATRNPLGFTLEIPKNGVAPVPILPGFVALIIFTINLKRRKSK